LAEASALISARALPRLVEELDSLNRLPIDSQSLTICLHNEGINLRYLGKIAELTKLPHVKALCLQEMLARAAKKFIRQRLA
jgi:protein TIF31